MDGERLKEMLREAEYELLHYPKKIGRASCRERV